MEEKFQGEAEEKSYSKLQWFFIVIFIPSIFALAVALIVLTVAGVNVIDKAKEFHEKIPFLPANEEIITEKKIEEMDGKIAELTADIELREKTIAQLQRKLESKDNEMNKLKMEKERLEKEMNEILAVQSENMREFKEIIKTYETISAKKAAPIITKMNEQEALAILAQLKPGTLAAIMEQMNAADAAKYTSLLTKNSEQDIE